MMNTRLSPQPRSIDDILRDPIMTEVRWARTIEEYTHPDTGEPIYTRVQFTAIKARRGKPYFKHPKKWELVEMLEYITTLDQGRREKKRKTWMLSAYEKHGPVIHDYVQAVAPNLFAYYFLEADPLARSAESEPQEPKEVSDVAARLQLTTEEVHAIAEMGGIAQEVRKGRILVDEVALHAFMKTDASYAPYIWNMERREKHQ